MNVVIPPLIFYVLGAALVIGGAVRALTLGRRNPSREIADDDPTKQRARRRHLLFGLVWIGMGLFLIGSTAAALSTRAETSHPTGGGKGAGSPPGPVPGSSGPGSGPTLRLEPVKPTSATPPAKQ